MEKILTYLSFLSGFLIAFVGLLYWIMDVNFSATSVTYIGF